MSTSTNSLEDGTGRAEQLQLYLLGHLLAEAVTLSEKLSHSSTVQNAYRYSRIVDYSTKGFDCTQAAALMKVHKAEMASNPALERDIKQLLEISDKIKVILSKL